MAHQHERLHLQDPSMAVLETATLHRSFVCRRLTWDIFCDNEVNDGEKCLRRYQEHYELVREVVPQERLVEWEVAEGWDPED